MSAVYEEVKGRWGKNPVRIFNGERYHYIPPYYSNRLGMLSNAIWNHFHPDDPVLDGEIVHHKNEITTDDRIDNYEKYTRGKHMELHEIGRHNGPCSDQTKQKLSLAHLGKPVHSKEHKEELSSKWKKDNPMHHPEVKKKLSKALKGRVFSDETKKRMSESAKRRASNRKGVVLSEETRKRISNAHKARKEKSSCESQS